MSSGQWEVVVGKNKKTQNGKIKTKDDEKKSPKNGPKLEDLVTHSQIKSFYAGMEVDDGGKPPKESKRKEGEKKNKKQDKKAETQKPKPPRTLEGALQAIDINELSSIITSNKVRFSNAPLVWLKEVATFLNSKTQVDIEDPTFSHYPETYPMSVVPAEVRESLESILRDVGEANALLFFDVTLTTLANDMSRGQCVNGHRLLLQMLGHENPKYCTASIQKSVNLRNSYQNRPPIGLSLLWALGQGGYNDFSAGIKAWQDIYLPIIELKNYTKYVLAYITKLLDKHAKESDTKISHDDFVAMFDLINNKKNTLSKEVSNELMKQLSKYKDIYFNRNNNKLQVTFNQLMKKLPNQYLSGPTLDAFNRILVESLIDCLAQEDSCNLIWRQLFHKCSKQSATLLDYINNNWAEVSPRLKVKSFKLTVSQYREVGLDALKGKKRDETVAKTNKICQDILDRMTRQTRRFPWFWASFFLLVAIGGLVAYDVSKVGGDFPKSATGKIFKDLGILEPSQKAWHKTLSASAKGYVWLETNVPIYYAQTSEICKPYIQLSKDILIVAGKKTSVLYENIKDYIFEKTPVVVATIDQYAPGLVENVKSFTVTGYETVRNYSTNYYMSTAGYLKTKVFVGDWAPEILQNKTQTALIATRNHMTSYFHWFRQQVHVYSEIP